MNDAQKLIAMQAALSKARDLDSAMDRRDRAVARLSRARRRAALKFCHALESDMLTPKPRMRDKPGLHAVQVVLRLLGNQQSTT